MSTLVQKSRDYCIDLLKSCRCQNFPFHNFEHTLNVYNNVIKIGKVENLSKEKLIILQIAALFHDTGYAEVYKGHEELSVLKAKAFLIKNQASKELIDEVEKCIHATKMPQKPHSQLEEIICDADLAHLGEPDFFEKSKDLRLEWEQMLDKHFSNGGWKKLTFEFLDGHRFFTDYAQKHLVPQQLQNQERLRQTM